MNVLLKLSFSHLMGRPRQTVVSIAGVAVGVGFFIAMAALMQGFQAYFVQKIIDITPHIMVKDEFRTPPLQPLQTLFPNAALDLKGLKPKDEKRGIRNHARIHQSLKKLKEASVTKGLEGEAFLNFGSKTMGVALSGIDPEAEKKVSTLDKDIFKGKLDNLLVKKNGIIIGIGVSEKLGLKMNDTVTVVSSEGVILRMKIVGIFSTGLTTQDNRTTYVQLKKAQILLRRQNVINNLRLRIENVDDAEIVARQIENQFGYRTESWQESNVNVLSIFKVQNLVTYSTIIAILIVSSLGIFNIISTIVFEKSRDIAILKSIGFFEEDIKKIFLVEGFLVGIIGSILGWGLGYSLCLALEQVPISVKDGAFIRIEGFYLLYTLWHYSIGAIVSITSAVLAAYLPARKAAYLKPVDIIRGAA
ncbi:MAG: ABC transporter permease [Alphaproteobacteria bacterium]|nr:ABC transporter permease [Alphaproteobacteria bacterium]